VVAVGMGVGVGWVANWWWWSHEFWWRCWEASSWLWCNRIGSGHLVMVGVAVMRSVTAIRHEVGACGSTVVLLVVMGRMLVSDGHSHQE